ncbi:MAG: hypothetical protein VKL42_08965 [Snowella sp.]|nr:hypothetical protein [Snowella sp.]
MGTKYREIKGKTLGYIKVSETTSYNPDDLIELGKIKKEEIESHGGSDILSICETLCTCGGVFFNTDDRAYYMYAKPGEVVEASYKTPLKQRTIQTNACGYAVITATGKYHHDLIKKVGGQPFNAAAYPAVLDASTISCKKNSATGVSGVGPLQGTNFSSDGNYYFFSGAVDGQVLVEYDI